MSDRQICRILQPKTASRVGMRQTCMRKDEWDARAKAAQDYTRDIQDSGKRNSNAFQ